MAFPAAPTESGGAKLHFLTTDGNAAAGWLAIDTGSTSTGSNTVGFAAIATHVHDDAAGAPGSLATTSVPLVLVGGVRDDALGGLTPAAGDAVYLLVDANGALWTHDDALDAALSGTELQVDVVAALPAGSNAIGKLAANSGVDIGDVDVLSLPALAAGSNAIGKLAANTGVDIGDVDVTSVVPGTAATNLGKAEDAAHSSGDVGVMAMSVRQNTAAALSGTDADYQPLITDTNGRLHVLDANSAAIKTAVELIDNAVDGNYLNVNANIAGTDFVGGAGAVAAGVQRTTLASDDPAVALLGTIDADTGAIKTAVELIDNPVAVLGTATYTEATTSGQIVGVVRNDTLATLANTDNEIAPLQVNASGALYTVLSAGAAVVGEVTIGAATGAAGDLAKIEDAQHASGDVGVMSLAVRNDALAALGGTDGDYVPLQADAAGALYTRPHSSSTGGCKMFTSVDLDESEEDPAAGPVTIYGIYAWNTTAAPKWLQMFNTNTVTVGTTAPTNNFMIPANADSDGAGVVLPIPVSGLAYSTALTVAATGAAGTDATDPGASACGVAIFYQD